MALFLSPYAINLTTKCRIPIEETQNNMSKIINVEIKARCFNAAQVKESLLALGADFKGVDHQIDTYFEVPNGRLKLRQGNIENTLIYYNRPNQEGPKQSDIHLFRPNADNSEDLKATLQAALPTKVVVDKHRAIYFIDNVKFHVDEVQQLGEFVEIEAIDTTGQRSVDELTAQCQHYMEVLQIEKENLLETSYSDMLLGL